MQIRLIQKVTDEDGEFSSVYPAGTVMEVSEDWRAQGGFVVAVAPVSNYLITILAEEFEVMD